MYKCPVPNCPEPYVDELLIHHCNKHHGMTRRQVVDTYGVPERISPMKNLLDKNLADFVQYGKVNNQYSFESTVREERIAKSKQKSSLISI